MALFFLCKKIALLIGLNRFIGFTSVSLVVYAIIKFFLHAGEHTKKTIV